MVLEIARIRDRDGDSEGREDEASRAAADSGHPKGSGYAAGMEWVSVSARLLLARRLRDWPRPRSCRTSPACARRCARFASRRASVPAVALALPVAEALVSVALLLTPDGATRRASSAPCCCSRSCVGIAASMRRGERPGLPLLRPGDVRADRARDARAQRGAARGCRRRRGRAVRRSVGLDGRPQRRRARRAGARALSRSVLLRSRSTRERRSACSIWRSSGCGGW